MNKILFFLFLLFSFSFLNSQNLYFTDSLYIEQLNEFLSNSYRPHPEVEQEYNLLVSNWNSGDIDNLKFGIVYVSNSMKENYAKAYPHFYYYISTLNKLIEKKDLDYYTEWEVGLLSITQSGNLRSINEYLKFSNLLIKDSILVQTPSITWKVNSDDYVIGNDPETQSLFIAFNSDIDIFCYNTHGISIDTFLITKTTGTCYPIEKKYIGEHGRIPWTQVGLPKDKVFAKFDEFELDMRQSKLQINDVLFTNDYLNLYQVPGKLQVKLTHSKKLDVSPIFESNDKLTIDEFFNNLIFEGYIKMKGEKFLGIGKKEPAIINIFDKNIKRTTLKSYNFIIEQHKKIYSGATQVNFFLNKLQDTIWHDNLKIQYEKNFDKKMYKLNWFNYAESDTTGPFLIMQRSGQGLSSSPFVDTYHNLNIYAEKALWKKNDSLLYFVTTQSSNIDYAIFESKDFFNGKDYQYFSGAKTDHFNHLAVINNLNDTMSYITIEDYQNHLKKQYNKQLSFRIIERLFQKLSYSGFVRYNRKIKTIYPTPKIKRYLQNAARIKQKDDRFADFDKLMIISKKSDKDIKAANTGVNAKINLKNNELKIDYIKPFNLSPTVKIYTNQITVKKNRNLTFGGDVGAGLTKIHSNKFHFDYKDYFISVRDSVSTLNLWTTDTVNGRLKYTPITTPLENLKANIYINASNNKSNTLKSDEYPKIKTTKPGVTNYTKFLKSYGDETDTISFKKDFYFQADNFEMDSLNYLNDSTLTFEGTMYTGLFKPLPVTLRVFYKNGKKSLGFKECTDQNPKLKDGLKFKDGTFFGCFSLNDQGLFGDGYIEYYSSHVNSTNFAFLPDKVSAKVDSFFVNNEKYANSNTENIPNAIGYNTDFLWEEKMIFNNKDLSDSKITLYSKKLKNPGKLEGKLFYKKDSLKGIGDFKFSDAEISDTNFVFLKSKFKAPTCDFTLKINNNEQFKTKNLNGNVDINKKLGSFYSNENTSKIVFAPNRYVCIMDHFLWKIGEGIVNIGGIMPGEDSTNYVNNTPENIKKKNKNENIRLYGTILKGMNDSLTFNAAQSTYKIEEKIIIADEVPEIKVADAKIFPADNVIIEKGGKIRPFENTSFEFPYKIFSDSITNHYLHKFNNAKVTIKNKYNYIAEGAEYTYPYKSQIIDFKLVKTKDGPDNIDSTTNIKKILEQKDLNSYAEALILSSDTLFLNEYFIFNGVGNVYAYANKDDLTFEGYTKMTATCDKDKMPIKYFKINKTQILKDSVYFSVNWKQKTTHGNLESGIFWTLKTKNRKRQYFIEYPFLGKLNSVRSIGTQNAKAWPIFKPNGYLTYNEKVGQYRISKNLDLLNSSKPDTLEGNMFSYNKNLCLVQGQGTFDIFMPWDISNNNPNENDEHVKGKFKGFYRNNIDEKEQYFQGVWAIDFIAPEFILNKMANACSGNINNPSIFEQEKIERTRKNFNIFLGKELTDYTFSTIENNRISLNDSLRNQTIVFSDVNMVFNPDSSALVSTGKLGITTINGRNVNKYVKGYIKYRLHPRTRMIIIIIEPYEGVIYAFKYRFADNGTMNIFTKTGNEEIDNYISKMKDRDKTFGNYKIIQTGEPEIKNFTKEYFRNN